MHSLVLPNAILAMGNEVNVCFTPCMKASRPAFILELSHNKRFPFTPILDW